MLERSSEIFVIHVMVTSFPSPTYIMQHFQECSKRILLFNLKNVCDVSNHTKLLKSDL